MEHLQAIRYWIIAGSCLLGAAATLFCLGAWFYTSPRWRTLFSTLDRQFRSLPPFGKLVAIVFLATFIVKGSTKTNNAPPPSPPPGGMVFDGGLQMQPECGEFSGPRLTTNQYRAGFALVRVATNAALSFAIPSNAVLHAPWTRYGVSEDTFWLPATNWAFILGTNAAEGLHVSSSGTLSFGWPKGSPRTREMPDGSGLNFLAPLQTSIGIAPPAGRFWHAPTLSNSLLLTWQDVFANRNTNFPVSFQSELFANGDFTFRYDLSRFPPTTNHQLSTTNWAIGAQHNGGGETYAFGDTNRLVNGLELRWRAFGLLDPGIDDHDGDGLSTYDEVMIHGTDPRLADSDHDGSGDPDELAVGTDPRNPDVDGDGLADGIDPQPFVWNDPDADADNDGYPLWQELLYGTSDTVSGDVAQLLAEGARSVTFTIAGTPGPGTMLTLAGYPLLLAGRTTFSLDLADGSVIPLALDNAPGVSVAVTSPDCIALTGGTGGLALGGTGAGAATLVLPVVTIMSDVLPGHCCHYHRDPCAVYTAVCTPPLQGEWHWLLNGLMAAEGTNRLEVGHDVAGLVQVSYAPDGGNTTIGVEFQHDANCHHFVENLPGGITATNLIYANTDDDNQNSQPDHADFFVEDEDDLHATTPLTVPSCCPCVTHNATNWTCHIEAKTDNLRIYESAGKLFEMTGLHTINAQQTVYVEGRASSTNRYADWIDWEFEGLVDDPDGELVETNFTVRAVYTVIDLLDAPIRLEPVTAATNSQGVIVNPAGVADGALELYRVEVVPAGLIPDEAIHWTKSNDNVSFYAGQDTGRDAVIRGVTPGDFTLDVAIDDLPATYRPYIHGRVLDPTVTPIHVYIICAAAGSPAVGTNTVNAWVAEANRIYRQAAMSFYVAGVEHVVSNEWFSIDSSTEFHEMCSYANVSQGLELYCVNNIWNASGLHSDSRLAPSYARCGMAVGAATASLTTIAHEIGHACGLTDLYDYYPGDGLVSEDKTLPLNWSGGDGTGYHEPSLAYRDLTFRAIMNAPHPSIPRADIPLDALTVVSGTNRFPVNVGINQMSTRTPAH